MSFPSYPAYKGSGVEWLGKVPEHWKEKPLKAVASINDETLPETLSPSHEIEYVDISSVSLTNGIEKSETMTFGDAPSRARRLARDGDVLVSTVRTYLKAIAPVVHPPVNLVASTGFAVIRPQDGLRPGYLKYALQEEHFIQQIISRSTGVSYPAINASEVARIPACLPGLIEQDSIATFLDRETSKINALIAEQQRLIELLQEKRQAVISHAVTKGLNPDAPMKGSGVEWLGDVPEHWKIVRLGHCGRLQNGLNIGGEAFGSGDPFISYGDAYNNAVLPEIPSGLVRSSTEEQNKCSLETGDVLFTRTSESVDDIGIASVCLHAIPRSTFAGFLIRFRPCDNTFIPRYSRYLLRNKAVQTHFAGSMNMVTRASLSQGELKMLPICIPPLEEQQEIAAALDEKTQLFRRLIADAESTIALLQERRSALISAAVTGQIDVRGLVPVEIAA